MTAHKIAMSIPAEQYKALEKVRRKLKLNRSEAVQQALAAWLDAQQPDPRIEQYVRGYLAQPEDAAEGAALTAAWARGQQPEDW